MCFHGYYSYHKARATTSYNRERAFPFEGIIDDLGRIFFLRS